MATRFNLGQRVNTPYGTGIIDVLPYNEQSTVYIIWLDKAAVIPISKDGTTVTDRMITLDAKYLQPIN